MMDKVSFLYGCKDSLHEHTAPLHIYIDRMKFRAFDTRTNKMIATGYHVIGEVTMFSIVENYLFENKEGLTVLQRLNDVVEMPYVGMVDRFGKDIYVGDLYKISPDEDPEIHQVFFKNGAFCGGKSFNSCKPLGWAIDSGRSKFNYSYLEVIGNIWENLNIIQQS